MIIKHTRVSIYVISEILWDISGNYDWKNEICEEMLIWLELLCLLLNAVCVALLDWSEMHFGFIYCDVH